MSQMEEIDLRTTVYDRMETLKVVFKCVWAYTNADGKFVAGCVPCQHEKSICNKVRRLIDNDLNRLRRSIHNKYERLKKR